MRFAMAETPKLSVEKALEKLRAADAQKSKNARLTEKTEALEDEMKRLRAQRLRLDRHQRRTTERD
jgi:cell division protein FtsB